MVLTRATVAGPGNDGVMGTADDTNRPVNTTTSFVDQNQTYTSHPSHQVFLRQYVLNAAGDPVATGKLHRRRQWRHGDLGRAQGSGRRLCSASSWSTPMSATSRCWRPTSTATSSPAPNGFPQIVTATGLVEGIPNTPMRSKAIRHPASSVPRERTPHRPRLPCRHRAQCGSGRDLADGDIEIGLENPGNEPGRLRQRTARCALRGRRRPRQREYRPDRRPPRLPRRAQPAGRAHQGGGADDAKRCSPSHRRPRP